MLFKPMESTIYSFSIKDINSVNDATNIFATLIFSFAFYSLVFLVLKRQIPNRWYPKE